MLEGAKVFRMGQTFSSQQDKDPKHTARVKSKDMYIYIYTHYKLSSQSPELKPIHSLCQNVTISRYAKQVETYHTRFAVETTAKRWSNNNDLVKLQFFSSYQLWSTLGCSLTYSPIEYIKVYGWKVTKHGKAKEVWILLARHFTHISV